MNMSIAEARSHFASLVDRAAAGEEITITRDGRPVARVVPVRTPDPDRARRAFDSLLQLRRGATLGGLNWKALRDDGRK